MSAIRTGMDAIIAGVGTEGTRIVIVIVTEIMIGRGGAEVILVNALDVTEEKPLTGTPSQG